MKKNGINLAVVRGFITKNAELLKTANGKSKVILNLKVIGEAERLVQVTMFSGLADWGSKVVRMDGKDYPNLHKGAEIEVIGEIGDKGVVAHQVSVVTPTWEFTVGQVKDFLVKKGYTVISPEEKAAVLEEADKFDKAMAVEEEEEEEAEFQNILDDVLSVSPELEAAMDKINLD